VTQIETYTERVRRMVGRVLSGNGITRNGNGLYSLIGAEELSDSEQSTAGTSPPAAGSPAPGNPGGSWWVSLAVDDAGFAAQLFVCRSISERTVSPRGGSFAIAKVRGEILHSFADHDQVTNHSILHKRGSQKSCAAFRRVMSDALKGFGNAGEVKEILAHNAVACAMT
jgi:hypothetical protein